MFDAAEYQVTLVTAPDINLAKELAEGLVATRLAACVNIINDVSSVYRWEGKINWDEEVLLVIKGLKSNGELMTAHILSHHPYENPEVIHLPITGGSPDYLRWLSS